ncbi:hypothetical protein SAMN05421875_101190 [Acidovorax soli]|uniref:Uncharacterized protein n=1 Tax=Acidovorax soli TaxID=592050 RepID=A0A1H3VK90_9BURK|nr:hypothetical protein SAMN05421875_101190 [Acidovorax soli]
MLLVFCDLIGGYDQDLLLHRLKMFAPSAAWTDLISIALNAFQLLDRVRNGIVVVADKQSVTVNMLGVAKLARDF